MPSSPVVGSARPVIPDEIHGFSVVCALGPYPIDAGHTHRKAMYAELRPVSEKARRILKHMGRDRILGTAPLTQEAAAEVAREPDGKMAEVTAQRALAEAARLAKQVATA